MLSSRKKLQIVVAFATLFLFAAGVGCSGFFVDPVLTSIAVGPTATIQQGATVQESAIGTYNDGSTKVLGTGVQWSSSDATAASVNSSGLVTGVSQGSATITGAFQATSGTSSITVNLGNVTALVTKPAGTVSIKANAQQAFYAYATVTGESSPVDVSATANWVLSDTTDFSLVQGDPVTVTALTSAVTLSPATLTVSYSSTNTITAIPVTLTIIP